jgi:undecaprenyl-diphosphatase
MILESILLGLIQGLTEWLPVSSSGHLVIAQELLKIKVPLIFDVILHFGTLLAVFAFFWKDIVKILKSLIKLDFKSESGKLIKFIIIGTIPVAFAGVIFHDIVKSLFQNLFAVSIALIINGILLFLTKFPKDKKEMSYLDSLIVGFAQAFALIPGISRSGSTISTGLLRGVKKEYVFKFSFLLSIPAILAANVWELNNTIISNTNVDFVSYFIGMIVAAIVGYISLKFLFQILKKEKFYLFSFYCLILGIILLLI